MKRDYSVYYSTSNDELESYYVRDNTNYKIDVIDYLRHINKIDESYSKMKECYKIQSLTKKQIDRLNFIQYLYFLSKNDEYNSKKAKRELKKDSIYSDEFLFEFCEAKTFEEHIKLFDNTISNHRDIKKLYKNKLYRSDIEYLYLENLNRNENLFKDKYIEKQIKKHLYEVSEKERLTILEVLYIWQILILIKNHYVALSFMKNELFIDASLLQIILDKLIQFKMVYSNVFVKKQIIEFNETIVSIYRLIGSKIEISDNEARENQQRCIIFIEENKEFLNSNTVFLNSIFKNEKISKSKIVEKIKEILNKNNDGEIMFLALLGASELKLEEYSSYADELERIDYNKGTVESYKIQNLEFAIRLIKFWSGDKFDLLFLQSNMYLDPYLKLCLEYEDQKINYNQFLAKLDEISYIPSSMILNWSRLEKIFNKTNSYEWFKKTISKMSPEDLKNPSLKNYLTSFYTKITNDRNIVFLDKFSDMDCFIRETFDDVLYVYYSIIAYINVYRNYDDTVKQLIFTISERFDELEKIIVDNKYVIDFIYLLVSLSIETENKDIKAMLLDLLLSKSSLNDNKILLYGLTYDDKVLLTKYYDSIFESVLGLYNNITSINKNDYMIITQISQKSLGSISGLVEVNKNPYYYNDKKHYILKGDYDKNLNKVYKSLNLQEVEEITVDMKKDNILNLITHRIFFANIEKMGVGKIIKSPVDATGKELLKIMEKATGFDKIRKDLDFIRSGRILNYVWFNVYNMHSYFKDVEQLNSNLFANSRNELIKIDSALFHFSSLILAVKLGIEDLLLNDDRIYITSSIYEDLMYQKTFEITELTDGILEPRINYDDLFDDVCKLAENMSNDERVIGITKANIIGIKNIDSINKYDRDIFKFFVSNVGESNKYFIITEDPFYYGIDGFKQRSFGIYSYIVEKYIQDNKAIDSRRLLELTDKLSSYNYGFNISKNLFNLLLERSDDKDIRKVVEKIKDFVI